jgi:hypothetical protein
MYFLNGFVTGVLYGVTLSLADVAPARPEDPRDFLACETGWHLGITLGLAFITSFFLYLYMQTG